MSDERRLAPRADRALGTRLTREEVTQLRQGQLDGDVVKALMEVSAGLAAPAPPDEGELAPNGTGWRVAQGGPAERLHPRLWRLAQRSMLLAGFGPTWATLLGIHHSLVASFGLGLLPVAAMLGAVKVSAALRLRPLEQAPRPEKVTDCPSGTTVRLQGVVASAATVPTLFRGVPAVLFRCAVGTGEQTQGIDFDLELEGERVRVSVREAMLLGGATRIPEPPACGPVRVDWSTGRPRIASDIFTGPSLLSWLRGLRRRYEASIAPGDRVEVWGVLQHEPDPDNVAPFARQMPTRPVIRAGARLPLLIRRLG